MLYIDDKFTRHPKILKASAKLGANGAAQAIALYLDGLSYACANLTDGFLPDAFVCNSALVSNPTRVAFILSSREIHLWHRVRGGYQIHDYHHWNRNASEVREKREAERLKKQRQRKGNGAVSTACPPGCPEGTSRARASTNHDPRTWGQLSAVPKIKITDADASARVQISTEFARLCVLAHYAAEGLGDGADPGAIADEVKWALAAAQFDHPNPEDLTAAVHAVMTARAKGYRTPRQRKARAS